MSNPELEYNGSVFWVRWEPEGIAMVIDRIYEDSHHITTGEFLVTYGKNGQRQILAQDRINLLSGTSKQGLIKSLKVWDGLSVPWEVLVPQACTKVLNKFREGDPPVKLKDVEPQSEQHYTLKPLLPEGKPTLIHADGGKGKTAVACYFASLIQTGRSECGLTPIQGNVLYLDYEDDVYAIQDRIHAFYRGFGQEPQSEVVYRYCQRPFVDDIITIQKWIMEYKIKVVVVDSVGIALGGDLSDPTLVNALYRSARSLHVTLLLIAHEPKGAEDGTASKSPFGSAYWKNSARAVYRLSGSLDKASNTLELGLFQTKVNGPALRHPIGLRFQFADKLILASSVDVTDNPELASNLPLKDQIVALLKHGALTAKEIAETLQANVGSVREMLRRYNSKLVVQLQTRRGAEFLWGLLTHQGA